MIIWIDAQLSPRLATWISEKFSVQAYAVRDLGLHEADDRVIFLAGRKQSVIVMTKDSDFLSLYDELGSPPKILWITCGNTSNSHLQKIFESTVPEALRLLNEGEDVVEIRD